MEKFISPVLKEYPDFFVFKIRRLRQLVITIILSGFMVLTYGSSHYIDKNANGSNDGTSWNNAWESFSAVDWSTIQPGDYVYISGGNDSTVYNETMDVNASGTPGNFIVITKGKEIGHNGKVILDGQGSIQYGIVISKSAGISYFKISDLYFRNYEQAVRIRSTANVIYLDSLNIRRQWGQGAITLNGWNSQGDVTVIDSVFIRYCDIRSDRQVDAQTDCIYVQYANNVFILNNVIYQLNETGDSHSDGIQTANGPGRVVIANNFIRQKKFGSSHGMMLCHSRIDSALYIYNNVVWQQGGVKAISVEYQAGDLVDTYLYNNTIVLDNPDNVMYPVGFWPARIHSKNNIIYSVTPIFDFAADTPTDPSEIDYNIYRNTSSNEVVAFNGNYYSWNNWKTLTGSPDSHSYHSTQVDYPAFKDMANGDFSIQEGSPAMGKGVDLQSEIEGWGIEGVEWRDINGIPRSSTPSIGAFEVPHNDITGVEDNNNLPSAFKLEQNYPNPFNPTTTIKFSIPTDQHVVINIYNSLGEFVKTLVDKFYSSGSYSVIFNASDLASGMYIYRLQSDTFNETKKMILMK